jgi:hypothetical protein
LSSRHAAIENIMAVAAQKSVRIGVIPNVPHSFIEPAPLAVQPGRARVGELQQVRATARFALPAPLGDQFEALAAPPRLTRIGHGLYWSALWRQQQRVYAGNGLRAAALASSVIHGSFISVVYALSIPQTAQRWNRRKLSRTG